MYLRKYLVLSYLILFPLSIFAGISGRYDVSGVSPSNVAYTGTAVIEKNDEVYQIVWTFPDGSTDVGTGVKKNRSVAFVFAENGINTGVQLYEIIGNGDVLKGPWTRAGSTQKGTEKITKIRDSSHCHCCCN